VQGARRVGKGDEVTDVPGKKMSGRENSVWVIGDETKGVGTKLKRRGVTPNGVSDAGSCMPYEHRERACCKKPNPRVV